MSKISIIIPVYGTELYIGRCARSLFEQSYNDIEYLFINDCTPDNSINILKDIIEEYPLRKKQIRIISNSSNLGLPEVRRIGIAESTGQYIFQCDSDDYVETNMCQEMIECAIANDADVVISDYYRVVNNKKIKCKGCYSNNFIKESLYIKMFSQQVPFMVWNKLIKKDLFNNYLIYPTRFHAEDMALMLQIFFYAKNIQYIQKAYYNYFPFSQTASHKLTEEIIYKKFQESVENVRIVEKFYAYHNSISMVKNGLLYIKMTQRDKLLPLLSNRKYYKIWVRTFPEINKQILFNRAIRVKHKIKYVLILLHLYRKKI